MQPISLGSAVVLAFAVGSLYFIQLYLEYRKAAKTVQDHAGPRTLFNQATVLANFLPPMPGIALGRNFSFRLKYTWFQHIGWDIYAHVSAWPKSRVQLHLADAAAIKEVVSSRSRFPKPVKQYRVLSFFGDNIVASEGEQWKRYRKITAPAFSDRNNRLVWDESVKIMLDMFQSKWENKNEIVVGHCVDITLPIALFVIGVAGFGRKITWQEDDIIPSGHQMTFKDALHVVSTDVFMKLIVPKWAFGFTERLRRVRLAFDELERYMSEMIHARKAAEKKEERYDLFSSLLDANEDEDLSGGEAKLLNSELIGNIFIFLIAGHETTAHTLCFTFAMLAMYPEEQEILYQHIKKIIPDDRLPTYEEMPLLTHSMAVFNETLRMFPPVNGIPKYSAEDTVLTTGNSDGGKKTIPVPQGTGLTINTAGLHYNPRYWEDPYTFKPSRFLGDWPRDAFLPFSAGARACLGRKFFETEGIAILTMLVSRYKIEVKEEPQFAGETFDERKARILNAKPGLTLTPIRVPLVFKRR